MVPELFDRHRGAYLVRAGDVSVRPAALDLAARRTVDVVLDAYGRLSGEELSQRSHAENPWRGARQGLTDEEPSGREIDPDTMRQFYAAVKPAPVGGSRRFHLRGLLHGVTPENRHAEVPTGRSVGREAW